MPRKTTKKRTARRSAPMPATIESLGALEHWGLCEHRERLPLGDPRANRGVWPASLDLAVYEVPPAAQAGVGPRSLGVGVQLSGEVKLVLFRSDGTTTGSYGPGHVTGADLPELRRKAVEWAQGYVESIARDLGLVPVPFQSAPSTEA